MSNKKIKGIKMNADIAKIINDDYKNNNNVLVNIAITYDLFIKTAIMAHKTNVTFNEYVAQAISFYIERDKDNVRNTNNN